MEALSRLFAKGMENGLYLGFKINPQAPAVIHVLYVDDIMIFGRAMEQEMKIMLDIIYTFIS
ncbi:hypothetical protein Taro_043324 [Colocasia esculenta]|uniref:Reverse transcriptase n=1 Tax=Colocasia esculenta TaxID=4460 RepID=A0A843WYP2_COLES|nr:hypothetical protein [Colocasia esculenta]